MATLSLHSHSFLLVLLPFILILRQNLAVAGGCQVPPVIFNFGDSNSDTGGLFAGLGYSIGLPNGRSFFQRSTGRLSDGRLVIDFLCKSTFS
ncbi:GDSL esterase/lipase [Arabidopsis thaliana]